MSAPVELGWAAMQRHAWTEATDLFAEAADATDDPTAHEGLAWALWWRNDGEGAMQARGRAYTRYRETGDPVGAARAALWLGSDHLDFLGETAVANGWFQRAHRLLRDAPLSVEHGWLAIMEGGMALELADDTVTALRCAGVAATVAEQLGDADLEFMALACEGLALVTQGQVTDGLRRLDEAGVAATAGDVTDPKVANWILCYVIYACERVRDFDRAAQWCTKASEVSERPQLDLGIGVCRAHYGGVLMYHGEWDHAERELNDAGEILRQARQPYVMESEARLGELRRRQGRLAEAADLFMRSEPHPLAVLGQACIALEEGAASQAADIASDLLDATPMTSVTQRADALEILARARLAGDDRDGAATAAAELAAIVAVVDATPLLAMSRVVEGLVAEANGLTAAARRCLEDGVEQFDRAGLPFEAARARLDLARVLEALDRADAAARQRELGEHRLRELGAALPRAVTPPSSVDGLSPREIEVIVLVARGLSDREIAAELTISAHTVHRHVSNILGKLGLPSRAAAAAYAARQRLGAAPS